MEIKNPEKTHRHEKQEQLHVGLGTDAFVQLATRERESVDNLQPLDVNNLPFEVLSWHVVVEPRRPPIKIGNILVSAEAQDAERFKTNVGRIVAIGDGAFKSKTLGGIDLATLKTPKVGDYVMHKDFNGQEAIMQENGRRLRIMDDVAIFMIIKDPEQWRMYL